MSTSSTIKKEYDDSPPRNGIIFFYAALTVFLLIGVKFLLDSYFSKTMESELHEKVATRGMDQVAAMRASEKQTLERSGMSGAMKAMAQRGRMMSPIITPSSGQGKPEVQGWTQLGRKVEAAPAAPSAVEPAPAPAPTEAAPATPAGH